MKWGKTKSQKIKEELFRNNWHKWFAWYPIHNGNQWVWLEYVERRRSDYWSHYKWEYKHMENQL
jgi:hypothetical protein